VSADVSTDMSTDMSTEETQAEPTLERQHALLRSLLFDPAFREDWAAGEAALTAAEARMLAPVDRGQLDATARRMGRDVRRRARPGCGTLEASFAASLATLPDSERPALFDAFVASGHYARVRELPDAVSGEPVEQAFAAFLGEQGLGEAVTRRRERDAALIKSLAQHPEPGFVVPPQVQRGARGYYVIDSEGDDHRLTAAVDGKLIQGAVTGLIAAVLREPALSVRAPLQVFQRLVAMGLLSARV